ncbi:unnamed protein product [Ixodes pacificus]
MMGMFIACTRLELRIICIYKMACKDPNAKSPKTLCSSQFLLAHGLVCSNLFPSAFSRRAGCG